MLFNYLLKRESNNFVPFPFKEQKAVQDRLAREAFLSYRNEDAKISSPLLLQACELGYYDCSSLYADVCFRDLDKKGHSLEESFYWYLIAADTGDADVHAWLNSECKDEKQSDEIFDLESTYRCESKS